jgi:hypothetical protein
MLTTETRNRSKYKKTPKPKPDPGPLTKYQGEIRFCFTGIIKDDPNQFGFFFRFVYREPKTAMYYQYDHQVVMDFTKNTAVRDLSKITRFIAALLQQADKVAVENLVGTPVELVFIGKRFSGFRILTKSQ